MAVGFAVSSAGAQAGAQAEVQARVAHFRESRGPLHTDATSPYVRARAAVTDELDVGLDWEADVVSAATVAVVDSPADVDAISHATQMTDFRSATGGWLRWSPDRLQVTARYGYGEESDFRGHQPTLAVSGELREAALRVEVQLGLGFHELCDLASNTGLAALDRQRISNSRRCFRDSAEVASRSVETQTLSVAVTHLPRPDVALQLGVSAQRNAGFLASPYREVWLGPFAAQEHHPDERLRGSAYLEARVALPRLRAFVRGRVRAYSDDWGVTAATAELAWHQRLGDFVRLELRGRVYGQSAAAFYSDDYVRQPRGRWFTGDRELAATRSLLGGVRVFVRVPLPEGGALSSLRIAYAFDVSSAAYDDFSYGRTPYPDGFWMVNSLAAEGRM